MEHAVYPCLYWLSGDVMNLDTAKAKAAKHGISGTWRTLSDDTLEFRPVDRGERGLLSGVIDSPDPPVSSPWPDELNDPPGMHWVYDERMSEGCVVMRWGALSRSILPTSVTA